MPLGFRREWKDGIAEVEGWVAYDALADPELARELVERMRRQADVAGGEAMVEFRATGDAAGSLERACGRWAASSRTPRSCSTTSSMLKVYRRIEAGVNPELELLRFLTERGFPNDRVARGLVRRTSARRSRRRSRSRRTTSPATATAGSSRSRRCAPGRATSSSTRLRLLGEVTGAMHTVLASDHERPELRAGGAERRGARRC